MTVKQMMAACAIVAVLFGATMRAETKTVTGELISIMCYEGHGDEGRGEQHAACALKCVKEGYAVGILTDDKVIYKVTGKLAEDKNAKLQDLLTKRVTATGEIGEEGKNKTIDAASVEAAK